MRWLHLRRTATFSFSLVSLAAIASCTLLLKTSADQCSTTDDCLAKGPDFAGTVCGADHVCGKNAIVSCDTNASCIQAYQGKPYFCRQADHQCISLTSTDCPMVLGEPEDLANDKTIFLGAVEQLSGAAAAVEKPSNDTLDMVRQDFKHYAGGIPDPKGGAPRPVVWVLCDEIRDTANKAYLEAARHLVQDVRVPAVVGMVTSGAGLDMMNQQFIPGNQFVISMSVQSSAFTTLAASSTTDPVGTRLFFRTSNRDIQASSVMNAAVSDHIEALLKSAAPAGNVPTGQPMKVLILNRGDAFGKALASGITDKIVFNGKSAADNLTDGNLSLCDYGNFPDINSQPAQTAFLACVNQGLTVRPHLVILAGAAEGATKIIGPMDVSWGDTQPYRPRYMSTANTESSIVTIAKDPTTPPDFFKRAFIFSVLPISNPVHDSSYAVELTTFAPGDNTGNIHAPAIWDAAYVTYFAIAAVGNKPITGPQIAAQMPLFVAAPGRQKLDLTPLNITVGFSALTTGSGGLDFNGASGPLEWNLQTGDTLVDISERCIYPDGNGKPSAVTNSGFYFSAATGAPVGKATNLPGSCVKN